MTITERMWDSLLKLHEAADVTTCDLTAVLLMTGEEVEAELSAARVRRTRGEGGNIPPGGGHTLMTGLLSRPDLPSGYFRGRGGVSMLDLF